MQRLGGGGYTRKTKRGGGNDPTCGCDMQAGWPKFLTDNIPLPTGQRGGGTCGAPPIPNYYQGGGGCAACSGLPLPTPLQQGGGQPTYYNSNPVPDACPFPGTGYCGFYAKGGSLPSLNGGANYGEPMYLQARLRGGSQAENNLRRRALRELLIERRPATEDRIRQRIQEIQARAQPNQRPLTQDDLRRREQLIALSSRLQQTRTQNANNQSNIQPTNTNLQAIQAANSEEVRNALYGNATEGGGCGCGLRRGGYRPTKKNLAALKKWRKGQSIGFTMTSSLKAKGLIPRTSRKHKGKKVVSAKYK